MNKHVPMNAFSAEDVFVSSALIRAEKREQVLRRQRTIALVVGFAALGLGPFAICSFKQAAPVPSSSQAAPYEIGSQTISSAATAACVAAAQAALQETMTRFHAEQDAFRARLPQAGETLFAGATKVEPDASSLSRFIPLDLLSQPSLSLSACASATKEPVS